MNSLQQPHEVRLRAAFADYSPRLGQRDRARDGLRGDLDQWATAEAPPPLVARRPTSVARKPVVREGGLRVVVAAVSTARPSGGADSSPRPRTTPRSP